MGHKTRRVPGIAHKTNPTGLARTRGRRWRGSGEAIRDLVDGFRHGATDPPPRQLFGRYLGAGHDKNQLLWWVCLFLGYSFFWVGFKGNRTEHLTIRVIRKFRTQQTPRSG